MNAETLAKSFPAEIELPDAFRALCDWVTENGYPISGYFELRAHDDDTIRCWFGSDKAVGDLAQFGAGADGSLYCLWRCPDGTLPVVHLDSGGENNYILASTPREFLRLLAIGYDELGSADLTSPPIDDEADPAINPNFQRWVSQRFATSIPPTGAEITESARAGHDGLQAWINERCG